MKFFIRLDNIELKLLYFFFFAAINTWAKYETIWFTEHGISTD